jgi:hypothetical protein
MQRKARQGKDRQGTQASRRADSETQADTHAKVDRK